MTTKPHTKTAPAVSITSTPTTGSTSPVLTPSGAPPTTTTAPSTTSSPVVSGMIAPVVILPPVPFTFIPVDLAAYRGTHPRQSQLALVPNASAEIKNATLYQSTLGPAAPNGPLFAETLDNALGWTSTRIAMETFLVYVKSQEAVCWKAGMTMMDQAKAAYDLMVAVNPAIVESIPSLSKLLEVVNTIGKKGSATRKRNKATKAATAASATSARTDSASTNAAPAATNPGTATSTSASGGTSH